MSGSVSESVSKRGCSGCPASLRGVFGARERNPQGLAGPYRGNADETWAARFVRIKHNTRRGSIPIPIPTPTPRGTKSRRIANHWLQATAKAAPEPQVLSSPLELPTANCELRRTSLFDPVPSLPFCFIPFFCVRLVLHPATRHHGIGRDGRDHQQPQDEEHLLE